MKCKSDEKGWQFQNFNITEATCSGGNVQSYDVGGTSGHVLNMHTA